LTQCDKRIAAAPDFCFDDFSAARHETRAGCARCSNGVSWHSGGGEMTPPGARRPLREARQRHLPSRRRRRGQRRRSASVVLRGRRFLFRLFQLLDNALKPARLDVFLAFDFR
jgi:hypothetical protein